MARTLIMAIMCQSCEEKLLVNGQLKGPIRGSDLQDLSKTDICHFCGKTMSKGECASLITMTA